MTRLNWPSAVDKSLAAIALSMFRLNIAIQTQCWVTFRTAFYARMYFPVGFGVLLLLYYFSLRLVRKWYRAFNYPSDVEPGFFIRKLYPNLGNSRFREKRYRRRFRSLITRSYLSFLSFAYTYLSAESFAIFDCINISGTNRMRDFVLVECWSTEWYEEYLPSALLGIGLYMIGIVAVQLYLLNLYECGEARGSKGILGRTIKEYHSKYRWWDVAGLVWRLALVLTLRFGSTQPEVQIGLFLFLLFLRISLQQYCKPYVNLFTTHEEVWLILLTMVVAACGLTFYITNSMTTLPTIVTEVLYTVAIMAIFGLVVCTLYYVARVWYQYRSSTERHRRHSSYDDVSRKPKGLTILAPDGSKPRSREHYVNGPWEYWQDLSDETYPERVAAPYVELEQLSIDDHDKQPKRAAAPSSGSEAVSSRRSHGWSDAFTDLTSQPEPSPSFNAMSASRTPSLAALPPLPGSAGAVASPVREKRKKPKAEKVGQPGDLQQPLLSETEQAFNREFAATGYVE